MSQRQLTMEEEVRQLEQLPQLRAWRGRRPRWAYTWAALARWRRATMRHP